MIFLKPSDSPARRRIDAFRRETIERLKGLLSTEKGEMSLQTFLQLMDSEFRGLIKATPSDDLKDALLERVNCAFEALRNTRSYVFLNPDVCVTGVLQDQRLMIVTENGVDFSYKTEFRTLSARYAENTCALYTDNHTFYFIGLQADLPPTLIGRSGPGDAFVTWNPFLEKKKPHPYWEKALEIAKQINTRFYEHGQE